MKLLGIDTSTASTVVVAADGDRVIVRRHDPLDGQRPAHTTAAMPLAAEAIGQLGLEWDALDRVGVGIGPGSFTGLRSGLSAAAGLARRLAIPLVGVTSTQQLALAARAERGAVTPILAVVDGRRRELFVERFVVGAEPGGASRPFVLGCDAVGTLGSLDGWLVIGDGALLKRDALLALGADVPKTGDPLHRLCGVSLATLTAGGAPTAADDVRPAYGREADAIPTAERPVKPIPGAHA